MTTQRRASLDSVGHRRARARAPRVGHPEQKDTPLQQQLQAKLSSALEELLTASNVPQRARASALANVTKRSRQATTRWLRKDEAGGLPDLLAFRELVKAFNADANHLLGLLDETKPGGSLQEPPAPPYLQQIAQELKSKVPEGVPMYMSGDEMEPLIHDGALLWIDPKVKRVQGNGVYALRYQSREVIRIVEERLGEGYALQCFNDLYREVIRPAGRNGKIKGVDVIGKVESWAQVTSGQRPS